MDISDIIKKSVCVVIINYNKVALLTECAHSVSQSSVLLKIYVSDNGPHSPQRRPMFMFRTGQIRSHG